MSSTEVLMQDGEKVMTHCVLYPSELVNSLVEEMLKEGDMVVGFDMEHAQVKDECRRKISLLSFCSNHTCVLVDLRYLNVIPSVFSYLSAFLNNKDIVFGCGHKRNDLVSLKEEHGLEIRNVLDVSELAALAHGLPTLSFFGVRKLASYIGLLKLQPRSIREMLFNWRPGYPDDGRTFVLSREEVQCATVDAYAAYKVTKYLLE